MKQLRWREKPGIEKLAQLSELSLIGQAVHGDYGCLRRCIHDKLRKEINFKLFCILVFKIVTSLAFIIINYFFNLAKVNWKYENDLYNQQNNNGWN